MSVSGSYMSMSKDRSYMGMSGSYSSQGHGQVQAVFTAVALNIHIHTKCIPTSAIEISVLSIGPYLCRKFRKITSGGIIDHDNCRDGQPSLAEPALRHVV